MWEGERRQVMRLPHSGHCYTIGLRPTHTCVYVCVLAEQWPLGRVSWMINSVFFCLSFVPSFFVFIYLYIYLSNHLDPWSTPHPLPISPQCQYIQTYKHTHVEYFTYVQDVFWICYVWVIQTSGSPVKFGIVRKIHGKSLTLYVSACVLYLSILFYFIFDINSCSM